MSRKGFQGGNISEFIPILWLSSLQLPFLYATMGVTGFLNSRLLFPVFLPSAAISRNIKRKGFVFRLVFCWHALAFRQSKRFNPEPPSYTVGMWCVCGCVCARARARG